jgi:hypothetical protein
MRTLYWDYHGYDCGSYVISITYYFWIALFGYVFQRIWQIAMDRQTYQVGRYVRRMDVSSVCLREFGYIANIYGSISALRLVA